VLLTAFNKKLKLFKFFLISSIFSIVFCLILLNYNLNTTYFLFIVNELLGLYLFSCVIIFSSKDIFEPIYFILLLFFFQYYISAFFLYNMTIEYIPKKINNQYSTIEALSVVNLALISFMIGYYSKFYKIFHFFLPKKIIFYNTRLFKLINFYMFLLFCCVISFLIYINGGIFNLLYSFGIPHNLRYLGYLLLFLRIVPYLMFLSGYKKLSIFSIVLMFSFYLFTQSRSQAILLLFWYLIFLNYIGYNIKKFLIVFPILIIIGYFIGFIASENGQILLENPSIFFNNFDKLIDWDYLFVMSIGRLEELSMYLENVPSKIDFYYGLSLLSGALGLFRSLFPINYEDYTFTITSIACGYDAKSIGFAMGGSGIAELYINFSYLGVILGFFIYGVILKSVYLWMMKNKYNTIFIILYIFLLETFFDIIRDSFSAIFNLFSLVLTTVLILCISTLKVNQLTLKIKKCLFF
jgi:oligosaccharide repeat unit polymerase